MARRGCGVRVPGDVYGETLTGGPNAKPIEWFLIDPPVEIDPALNLPTMGIAIHERPSKAGTFDVYDLVGRSGYRNVADFVEETRRMGLSRKIPKNADFRLLSSDSQIRLAHPEAILRNAFVLYIELAIEKATYPFSHPWHCPCPNAPDHAAHNSLLDQLAEGGLDNGAPTCAGVWWDLVAGGDPTWAPEDYPRTVRAEVGDIRYTARHAPEDFKPVWSPGFFLRLPLHRLVVIEHEDDAKTEAALEKARLSDLPVEIVSE